MTRVVAFLRGINVGGHIVKKERLQGVFEALGFRDVMTYKQSGNVIFETEVKDMEKIRTRIEDKLKKTLGYDVAVFIRTMDYLKELAERNSRAVKEGDSFLVTMLPPCDFTLPLPITIPNSTAVIVSASGSEAFSLTHGGGEGALPNPILESKLKVKATTRNMNIIREIVEKYR